MNLENVDKGEVDEAILYANMKEMKVEMEKCEKLKEVKNEDFRKEQDYLMEKSVDKARMAFRLRSRMVPKVKMNFKNMHRNNLKCEECGKEEEETQEHVEVCPAWSGEMGYLDMTRMADRIEFFTRVLRRKK